MNPGLLVAALLAEPGLCGPVKPAATPDPAAAAPYVEVAEAEQRPLIAATSKPSSVK